MQEEMRIGAASPDFTLKDTHDRQVQLSGYRGRQAVVLVFNRGFI